MWAFGVRHWTEKHWRRVVFSDECKLNCSGSDGRQYCWRRKGDAYQARYTQKSWKSEDRHLMVWGCISEHGVGRLIRITGTMRARDYVRILHDGLLGTFRDRHMSQGHYIFQHDNDPKHQAKLTRAWLRDHHLLVLPWPPKSPDMNLIEHVWDYLKNRVKARCPQPTSLERLWEVTQEEWYAIPDSFIAKLYRNMPKRIVALRDVRGGNTSY